MATLPPTPFVFISYKREDIAKAVRLQRHLEADGISTWRDSKLVGGDRFDDIIEGKVRECSCLIVLWSELSVNSKYIKDEAALALDLKRLVPTVVEPCELPLRFRYLHTHQLTKWDELVPGPEYDRVKADIAEYLSVPVPKAHAKSQHRLIWARAILSVWLAKFVPSLTAAAAIAAAGLAVYAIVQLDSIPAPTETTTSFIADSAATEQLLLVGRVYVIQSRSGGAMRFHIQEILALPKTVRVNVSDTNGVSQTLTFSLDESKQVHLSTGKHRIKLDGIADSGALFSFEMQ